ncbi:MAG TPA: methyltransferase domain-containing protein [Longimicrobium sp.]|nr:methyltransferase domain-containing protein [Longimicrobium sp.]
MADTEKSYIPAAGRHWALPFYDLLVTLLGANRVRKGLAERVAAQPGHRVLDVGCGTGSLLVALKEAQPAAEVTGLDPDPHALAIARKKAARRGMVPRLDQGFAGELPYGDGSFDRVVSSLMYHHLPAAEKERMLREVKRVLAPGGRFHMLDFAGPGTARRGFLARHIHPSHALKENEQERVLAGMRSAGLADARVAGTLSSHAGPLVFYEAGAPPSAPG